VLSQQADGDTALVDIPGGRISVPAPAPGPATSLAARPEHITIHDDGNQPGRIPARVVFRRYLGFKATYSLELADGSTINVDVPTAHDPAHMPGAQVFLSFSQACR